MDVCGQTISNLSSSSPKHKSHVPEDPIENTDLGDEFTHRSAWTQHSFSGRNVISANSVENQLVNNHPLFSITKSTIGVNYINVIYVEKALVIPLDLDDIR